MRKIWLLLIALTAAGLFTETVALSTQEQTAAFNRFVEQCYRNRLDTAQYDKICRPLRYGEFLRRMEAASGAGLQCNLFVEERSVHALHHRLSLSSSRSEALLYARPLLDHYESVSSGSSSPACANQAKEEAAFLRMHLGEWAEAEELAREVLKDQPGSPRASEVLGLLCLKRAERLKEQGRYDEVLEEYGGLIHAGVAQMWQATATGLLASQYLKMGRQEEALRAYREIEAEHPDLEEWKAQVQYKIAQHHQNREGDPEKAREIYQRMVKEHPGSGWARLARKRLMELE